MALTVTEIFERTRRILLDEGGVRWIDAEMIDSYNEGLLDTVTRKGSLLPVIETFTCVAGCQQSVPVNRIAILELGRNLGPAATPKNGLVPRITTRDEFDSLHPTWQNDSAKSLVTAVIGSPNTPKIFWVYPAQLTTAPGRLEATLSKRPVVVTAKTESFELDDEYAPIIIEYLLYRAFSKDAENPAMAARSSEHFQKYLGLLGVGKPQPAPQQQ